MPDQTKLRTISWESHCPHCEKPITFRLQTERAPEPETTEMQGESSGPCQTCNGFGKVDGTYCTCQMGHDLERVESRVAKAEAAKGVAVLE
jgi:hypothetical protein